MGLGVCEDILNDLADQLMLKETHREEQTRRSLRRLGDAATTVATEGALGLRGRLVPAKMLLTRPCGGLLACGEHGEEVAVELLAVTTVASDDANGVGGDGDADSPAVTRTCDRRSFIAHCRKPLVKKGA